MISGTSYIKNGRDLGAWLIRTLHCLPKSLNRMSLLSDLENAQCFTLSIETVRTHVKHLLIKLDCRCQAGLMRKILLGPAISLTQKTPRC
jgi:hypothetical protein